MTMAGQNGFSITASMLMIAGPLLKIEDVLQTITIFNMDDGRKNVFSITVSMLKIMGPIFTFKNGRKKQKYMKLGHVNV